MKRSPMAAGPSWQSSRLIRLVRFIRCRVILVAFAVALGAKAVATPADPAPVTYIPEIGEVVRKACITPTHTGWIFSATITAARHPTMEIVCSIGHVYQGPTGECERNCGYDILRRRTVRLTDPTIAALRTAGCSDISICLEGLIINRPGYPSAVRVSPFGESKTLERNEPPLQVEYGSDIAGYWIIDASGNGPVRIWDAAILPLDRGGAGPSSALLVSRISLILPDLRADLAIPMVCHRIWIVSDRYLQQLGAFTKGRTLREVVRSLAASRLPKKVC